MLCIYSMWSWCGFSYIYNIGAQPIYQPVRVVQADQTGNYEFRNSVDSVEQSVLKSVSYRFINIILYTVSVARLLASLPLYMELYICIRFMLFFWLFFNIDKSYIIYKLSVYTYNIFLYYWNVVNNAIVYIKLEINAM